jgi:hypothetical protein
LSRAAGRADAPSPAANLLQVNAGKKTRYDIVMTGGPAAKMCLPPRTREIAYGAGVTVKF